MESGTTMRAVRARYAFATAAVTAALVILGSQADGAMWLRMTVDPSQPIVGQSAHVIVLTMANFNNNCINDPAADARPWWDWNGNGGKDLRFDLKAFQADRVVDIPLTRRESDPAYWDGSVAFPAAGEWTVRMVYPLWAGGAAAGEECAGSRITVTVRSSSSPPGTSTLASGQTAALAIFVLAIGGSALLGLRSLRSRSEPSH
jgi:hypothetical protein